jgi:hypothetical protein
MCAIKCDNNIMVVVQEADMVAEWLRRQTANLLCSARMSSNLIHVDTV